MNIQYDQEQEQENDRGLERDPQTERFVDLLNEHADEPKTRALLLAILEAKAAPDDQRAQCLAVSHYLAEVLENHFTPAGIYNEIAAALDAIEDLEGVTERDLRAGHFVDAMIKEQQEGKGNGKA